MLRMSGYFFAASKSAGFWTQAWIGLPSKLGYVISSGAVRVSSEKSASLKCVTWRGGPPAVSSTNRSPTAMGVEMTRAKRDASGVAVGAMILRLPAGSGAGLADEG